MTEKREFQIGDICISNVPAWTIDGIVNPEYELLYVIQDNPKRWYCWFTNPALRMSHPSVTADESVCVLVKPKVYSDGLDNWE